MAPARGAPWPPRPCCCARAGSQRAPGAVLHLPAHGARPAHDETAVVHRAGDAPALSLQGRQALRRGVDRRPYVAVAVAELVGIDAHLTRDVKIFLDREVAYLRA